MSEPNLYKIQSDVENLDRKVTAMDNRIVSMEAKTDAYRERQIEVLTKLTSVTERLAATTDATELRDKEAERMGHEIKALRSELDGVKVSVAKISALTACVAGAGGVGAAELIRAFAT